jgi:signal transduction histidine kinase
MGEILLTVEASDGLSVIVRDTGVGIAAERLPAILERFTPLDPACSDPGGIVGIGRRLATCLMERHGGRLTIESKLGVGNDGAGDFPERPDRISVIPDRRSGGLRIRRPQSL